MRRTVRPASSAHAPCRLAVGIRLVAALAVAIPGACRKPVSPPAASSAARTVGLTADASAVPAPAPRAVPQPAPAAAPPAPAPASPAPVAVSPAPVVPAVEPASPVAEAGIVRPDPGEARKLLDGLRALADRGGITGMSPFVWPRARARLARMTVDEVKALLSGEVAGTDVNGGRVVLRMRGNPAASVLVFHVGAGGLVWDPDASLGWREPDRGARVPENRDLSLDEACRDLSGKGRLVAVIETTRGTLTCELFADRAPRTVANFVGLARGLRAFRDVKTGKWVRRPFYDGLAFHHAVPKMLIQAGCPRGDGTGDPGYSFADEFDLSLRHDRPGRLSMAADAPNSNGSQFLVTEVPAPWLDDRRPVFGQCEPAEVVRDIARATPTDPRHGDRVGILRVTVRRED